MKREVLVAAVLFITLGSTSAKATSAAPVPSLNSAEPGVAQVKQSRESEREREQREEAQRERERQQERDRRDDDRNNRDGNRDDSSDRRGDSLSDRDRDRLERQQELEDEQQERREDEWDDEDDRDDDYRDHDDRDRDNDYWNRDDDRWDRDDDYRDHNGGWFWNWGDDRRSDLAPTNRTTRLEFTSASNDWVTVSIEGLDNQQELSFSGNTTTQAIDLPVGTYRVSFRPTFSNRAWESGYLNVGSTSLIRIQFDQGSDRVQVYDDPYAWTPESYSAIRLAPDSY
jgi:hypothetical protein